MRGCLPRSPLCSLCEDVTDEVKKHGEVLSSKAVPSSQGYLYLKFASEDGAAKCVGSLNGRATSAASYLRFDPRLPPLPLTRLYAAWQAGSRGSRCKRLP